MTTAPPRIDLFGPIHKAIRCALADLLSQMGATSFRNPAAATRIAEQVEEVTELCEDHRRHEERHLLPAVADRLQGSLAGIHGAHLTQPVVVAELCALARGLRTTGDEQRHVVGRTLYLHFSTFAAELLLHMAEEEQVLQPLLEKLFSDDELRAVHGKLLASLTIAERLRATPWMIRGTNPVERAALLQAAMSPVQEVAR